MQPASFDLAEQQRWSRWVLAHGLPDVPVTELGLEQSVPVAYWLSPNTAAVLHIRRYLDADDSGEVIEADVDIFCLVDDAWEGMGSGGGGWSGESPLARIDVPPDHVSLGGM